MVQVTTHEIVERHIITEERREARVKEMSGSVVWWCPFCDHSQAIYDTPEGKIGTTCSGSRPDGEACRADVTVTETSVGIYSAEAVGRSEVLESVPADKADMSLDKRAAKLDEQEISLSRRLDMLNQREADLAKKEAAISKKGKAK
jgi:hypothetical protein